MNKKPQKENYKDIWCYVCDKYVEQKKLLEVEYPETAYADYRIYSLTCPDCKAGLVSLRTLK